jgi:hypothetical protein
LSELDKKLPADCDGLPNVIVRDADKIYEHVVSGEPTPIVWQGDTEDPFRLDVVATLSPEPKRSTYGNRKMDVIPPRLRLESHFQIPYGLGSSHFEAIRAGYLHTLHQDAAVRRLVDARFTSNRMVALQLNPLGEPDKTVVTNAPHSEAGPFIVRVTNDRNLSRAYAPDRAPYFDKGNIRDIISSYLGLTWLVGVALGDPRIPRAALLDRYDKYSDSFYRKRGGGRPRPKTAYNSEPTKTEVTVRDKFLNELAKRYSPPAGIGPLAPNIDNFHGLDLDEENQIAMRIAAIREPERAAHWDLGSMGGIVIAGEKGSGKSTLALSIADQADVPLFFWPSDVIHAGDSAKTARQTAQLRQVLSTATNGNKTLGIVLESMHLFQHANPLEVEEISRLIRQAVDSPRVILIGTINSQDDRSTMPRYELIKQGLFGHGLFNTFIDLEATQEMMSNAITRLVNDDLVHGQRMFENLTHEKRDALLEYAYGHFTVTQIQVAIDLCKGQKFMEQARLNGQHPGPITIHQIIKALNDGEETKHRDSSSI